MSGAVTYVCPNKDIVCSSRPENWCDECPVKKAALTQSEPAPAPVESRDRDAYEGCREDLLDCLRPLAAEESGK